MTKLSNLELAKKNPVQASKQTNFQFYLSCPICQLEFFVWPDLESHLFSGHVSNVPRICWRCQGVFVNYACLLAHECFDWGRTHLPCAALIKSSYTKRILDLNSNQFPSGGVFISRRCGLCFRSTRVFALYQEFKRYYLKKNYLK